MEIRQDVPLAPLCYYKIGGKARYYCQPESVEDLKKVTEFLKETGHAYYILGAGSNVLLPDEGIDGLVIHTAKLGKNITSITNAGGKDQRLWVDAGVMVIQLLRHCMSQGVRGFEFAVGVPGNVGGILYMNAGTKLGEAKDQVQSVQAYNLATGQTSTYTHEQLQYSYRKNHFLKEHDIILGGEFACAPADPVEVQKQVQQLLEQRRKSQPVDKPSCGSVFKNPDPAKNIFAWKVNDQTGMRGFKVGAAQVSELHTNYIVNLGGATAADVKAVIAEAKQRALKQLGVHLEEEVQIIQSTPSARVAVGKGQTRNT